MNTSDSSPSTAAPLALPAELTIYTVGELHPAWCAWLATHATDAQPPVHAAGVDQIDGAGVQLLLSLGQGLAQQGGRLQLQAPSTPLRAACGALGLAGWLAEHTTTAEAA